MLTQSVISLSVSRSVKALCAPASDWDLGSGSDVSELAVPVVLSLMELASVRLATFELDLQIGS